MRKTIVAGVSILALCGAASAADMAVRMPTKAPPVMQAAAYSWSGLYVGAHVGAGWGRTDSTILESTNNFFPQGTVNRNEFDGWLGGGQVGYNYQFGQFVIGAEGQFSWADINGDNRHDAILLANRHSATTSDVDWVTTATGRLGYAVGNALIYAKGGGAWAEFGSSTNSVVTSTGQVVQTTSGSEKRSGWTAGGGIEFGLWSNWSMKAEYNFIDFGTERVTRSGTNFTTGAAVSQQRDADTQLHIAKVGINYRFGNFFGGSGGY